MDHKVFQQGDILACSYPENLLRDLGLGTGPTWSGSVAESVPNVLVYFWLCSEVIHGSAIRVHYCGALGITWVSDTKFGSTACKASSVTNCTISSDFFNIKGRLEI